MNYYDGFYEVCSFNQEIVKAIALSNNNYSSNNSIKQTL